MVAVDASRGTSPRACCVSVPACRAPSARWFEGTLPFWAWYCNCNCIVLGSCSNASCPGKAGRMIFGLPPGSVPSSVTFATVGMLPRGSTEVLPLCAEYRSLMIRTPQFDVRNLAQKTDTGTTYTHTREHATVSHNSCIGPFTPRLGHCGRRESGAQAGALRQAPPIHAIVRKRGSVHPTCASPLHPWWVKERHLGGAVPPTHAHTRGYHGRLRPRRNSGGILRHFIERE